MGHHSPRNFMHPDAGRSKEGLQFRPEEVVLGRD